jgi:hypothetical protein
MENRKVGFSDATSAKRFAPGTGFLNPIPSHFSHPKNPGKEFNGKK